MSTTSCPAERVPSPRLAVRALLLHADRLLLVNAYPGRTDLWCLPGGAVRPHESLPDALAREVHEETGLRVAVGAPRLVNEFHDPARAFHQVEIAFRCTLLSGDPDGPWSDPEGIVAHRLWASRADLARLNHKPDSLAAAAWEDGPALYDPLEPLLP
ncbi:NUDIX domain-containing protein [Rubellimicrobium sp. CFH 75288]|uniref:NUDIX domain-containing protein n=1 Tax=Rubellimicrobium sp. CFH 75288 TaxID=2697034 RepID=UPI0014127D17|nr:NUDIX hydrolase [Rubellimicrobium sp. CFH 75288]NAZ37460.1 NUDIX domain-containing protein [Rubellimicrobium sp. CFH 75288]